MNKKILVLVILLITFSNAIAQESLSQTNKPMRFEDALSVKGELLIKQFTPIKIDFDTSIAADIAYLYFPTRNSKFYAVKLTGKYYKSQYDSGEVIATLDELEIQSAIDSIVYMQNYLSTLNGAEPYTEVYYKSSDDFQIGFYSVSSTERKAFLIIGNKDQNYYYVDRLSDMKSFFESALAKINAMKLLK